MSELKPCPFCGGDDVETFGPYGWHREWGVSHSCRSFYNGSSELAQGFASESAAIEAWNTRASEAREADQKAKLEKAESEAQKSKNYVQALEDRLHWVLYSGPLNLSENRMQWLHEPFGDDLSSLPRSERQDTSPRCAECGGNGQVSRSFGFIPCEACNGKGF